MDAGDQDPIEMIVNLARGMMPERRSRFLDAACGDRLDVRAEVEARLNAGSQSEVVESPANSPPDETLASPSPSIESVALEAVSAVQQTGENGNANGGERSSEDVPIEAYC